MARGDADIDLLIVARDLEASDLHANLARIQVEVRSWTGNDLQLVEHTPESWRKLVRSKNPLVEQMRLDGVSLTGDTAALLKRRRYSRPLGADSSMMIPGRSL